MMAASRLNRLKGWARLVVGWVWIALAGLGLVACRPITDTSTPAPVATPVVSMPVEILYIEAAQPGATATSYRLTPDDDGFAALVDELNGLIASIDSQARTFFDPARFELEVASVEHVAIRYAEDVAFVGRDVEWQAVEMVAAVVNEEPMLLARAEGIDDWRVFLPESPQSINEFIESTAYHAGNASP